MVPVRDIPAHFPSPRGERSRPKRTGFDARERMSPSTPLFLPWKLTFAQQHHSGSPLPAGRGGQGLPPLFGGFSLSPEGNGRARR
jgi:hypothetical protein